MGANSTSLGRNASRSSGDVVGTNNLPSIMFHSNHGENVQLLRNGAIARRTESFCKGIAFSNRPVQINEKIFLKFAEISSNWSGDIRFGFTSVDPSTLRGGLPKYACPDLTNKSGFWAKALAERYAQQDAVLFYYVVANGDVYFGINGEEKGVFFSGVDTTGPLWALLDIYGNTIAMELLDPRNRLNNIGNNSVSSSSGMSHILSSFESLSVNASNQINSTAGDATVGFYSRSLLLPLNFHRVHGQAIQLSGIPQTALRRDSEYCGGYVFSERQLLPDERIIIKILQTDSSYYGALAFGLTACDPNNLLPHELPEDADLLLDRPEYWVVVKDVANTPQRGDELGFSITREGEVLFYKNNQSPLTIMHVDQTQRLWAFFDVYGNTLKIQLLGIFKAELLAHSSNDVDSSNQLRVILPPTNLSSSEVETEDQSKAVPTVKWHTSHALTSFGFEGNADILNNECAVCYERAIDSVLYSCGHMCMCYECAYQLWKRQGQCPICRAEIKDVIRAYRS